jgi:hypothetical protein
MANLLRFLGGSYYGQGPQSDQIIVPHAEQDLLPIS